VAEYHFASREKASINAAEFIVNSLSRDLSSNDSASIVVSGGSTPGQCFTNLSTANIDWQRVRVFLSDERWVPPDHPDSNEKLVREHLLVDAAKQANMYGVYRQDTTIEQRCKEIEYDIYELRAPFTSVLLGMGNDGHFASLFPDISGLAAALDLDTKMFCLPVHTGASIYPRVSLTLSALCRSGQILLLIFGEEKRQLLERAKSSNNAYPVSRLLAQDRTPVHVFWAA
jgi:6-phosphogluconolactonase